VRRAAGTLHTPREEAVEQEGEAEKRPTGAPAKAGAATQAGAMVNEVGWRTQGRRRTAPHGRQQTRQAAKANNTGGYATSTSDNGMDAERGNDTDKDNASRRYRALPSVDATPANVPLAPRAGWRDVSAVEPSRATLDRGSRRCAAGMPRRRARREGGTQRDGQ